MYSYSFDLKSGGIVLNSSPTIFSKEPRPVWADELDLLGFDRYWNYEKQNDVPFMWAESNVYWYRGIQIAKTKGGDLYNAPELLPVRSEDGSIPFSKIDGYTLQPIDMEAMCRQNEELMTIVEDTTVKKIIKEYEKFKNRLDIFHVAFSGGKDSAVLLDLVKKALPIGSFIVIFGDTGMEFPDTYDVVRKTKEQCEEDGTPFYIAKSHFEPCESWKLFGPPSKTLRWCCSVHKSTPQTIKMREILGKDDYTGLDFVGVTSDSLCEWIKDIIAQNHTKIVLIWDEFSGFFRQNRNSLDEFQKIVALCQETHFYFVIVTHPITSIAGASISKDDPMSVVMQRYKQVEISLPSNIAFELIGHAFSVIDVAKDQWEAMTGDLNSRVTASKTAVMKVTEVKSDSIMRHLLPIHPMAALVLKNIATAFQSNQRSMFDFIKTPKDLNIHAFQWFIQNTSPVSERPLLTVDMLWNFFYENGKDYLTSDIKLILDTYPQQTNLTEKEKVVLKTILIMQAVDQRLGGAIPVLKPTDQNLSYAFEGDWDVYENECRNIAKALVKKGVLI